MEKIDNELLMKRFEESGFNYIELAEQTNISRNTIHNIMYGRTTPSYFVMVQLAYALKLTPGNILAIFFPKLPLNEELAQDKYGY